MSDKNAKNRYKGPTLLSGDKLKAEKERQAQKREAAAKNAAGRPTFAYIAEHDEDFRAACERAGIPATARQASKYARKRGLAYQNRNTNDTSAQ